MDSEGIIQEDGYNETEMGLQSSRASRALGADLANVSQTDVFHNEREDEILETKEERDGPIQTEDMERSLNEQSVEVMRQGHQEEDDCDLPILDGEFDDGSNGAYSGASSRASSAKDMRSYEARVEFPYFQESHSGSMASRIRAYCQTHKTTTDSNFSRFNSGDVLSGAASNMMETIDNQTLVSEGDDSLNDIYGEAAEAAESANSSLGNQLGESAAPFSLEGQGTSREESQEISSVGGSSENETLVSEEANSLNESAGQENEPENDNSFNGMLGPFSSQSRVTATPETRLNEYSTAVPESPEVRSYAEKLMNYEEQVRDLEARIADLSFENVQLEQLLKSQEESAANMTSTKDMLSLQDDINNLQRELQREKSMQSFLESELTAVQTSLLSQEKSNGKLLKEMEEIKCELSECKFENAGLEQKLQSLPSQLAESEAEVRRLHSVLEESNTEAKESNAVVQEQRALIAELQISLDAAAERTRDYEAQMELEASLSSSLKENSLLQKQLHDAQIQQARFDEVQQELHDEKQLRRHAQNNSNQLNVELLQAREHVQLIETQLAKTQEKVLQLSNAAEESKANQEYPIAQISKVSREEVAQVEKFVAECAEKLKLQPRKTAPIVAELSQRLEVLMEDRCRSEEVIQEMRKERAEFQSRINDLEEKLALDAQAKPEETNEMIKELQNQVEGLKMERDKLEEHLRLDESFSEVLSVRESEDSYSPNREAIKLLPIIDELQQQVRDLESTLSLKEKEMSTLLPGRSKKQDCHACLKEISHCDMIAKNELELAAAHGKFDEEYRRAVEIADHHIQDLQHMIKHEAQSNAELRSILEVNEKVAESKLEQQKEECKDLEMKLMKSENREAEGTAIIRSIARTLSGLYLHDALPTEALESTTMEIVQQVVEERDSLKLQVKRSEFLEKCTASLRLQKQIVHKIYSSRGELPPGVAWKAEQVRKPVEKLRSAVHAILGVKRLLRLNKENNHFAAVDVAAHFQVRVAPSVWCVKSREVSPTAALTLLPSIQSSLDESRKIITDLESQISTLEVRVLSNQSRELSKKTFEAMQGDNRALRERLARQQSSSAEKEEELIESLHKTNELLAKAEASAAGEREARQMAEARVLKYVRRAEHYSNALSRAKAESKVRNKSLASVVDRISKRMQKPETTAAAPPAPASPKVRNDLSLALDKENCLPLESPLGDPNKEVSFVLPFLEQPSKEASFRRSETQGTPKNASFNDASGNTFSKSTEKSMRSPARILAELHLNTEQAFP